MDIYPKSFSKTNTRKKQSKYNKDILIKSQNKEVQKDIFISVNEDNIHFSEKHNHYSLIFKNAFFYKSNIVFAWEANSSYGRKSHIDLRIYNTNIQGFAPESSILAWDFSVLEEAEQRQKALAEMANSGLEEEMVLLLKYLDAIDPNIFEYGINKLKEIDINILLAKLKVFLSSNKPWIRRKIVDTLGETKNEMTIPTLCEVLLEDRSPIVCIGAAKALGKIGAING
jgi:hypothetical protein